MLAGRLYPPDVGRILRPLARLSSTLLFCLTMSLLPLTIVGFVVVGGDGWRAHHNGVSGTLTVADCQWDQRKGSGAWSCSGRFVSDDQTVRRTSIELAEEYPHPLATGEQVPALVAGPHALNAWRRSDGAWWMLPILILLTGTIASVFGMLLYRRRLTALLHMLRHGRAPKPLSPAATMDVGPRVPQLGNRARRRIRKHR
jgi:hypothetical protein